MIAIFAINIRPMRIDDVEQVCSIDRQSFTLPWPDNAYSHELKDNPAARLWVAEDIQFSGDPMIVGIIVMWLVLDEAHIATLAVHPDFRREGIGKRLLVVALQAAIQNGARQALLEVRANNQAAQALYRQFGFDVSGRRPRYYRDNQEDALLMTLDNLSEAVFRGR
jgi:ribosomal-protein-alanine N-acetyltransferase